MCQVWNTFFKKTMNMNTKKKPKGFDKFDALTRLLVRVPKSEIPERKQKFKPRKKK